MIYNNIVKDNQLLKGEKIMTRKELIESPDYVVNSKVKIAGTNYDRRRVVTKSMQRRMIQMYESGKSLSSIAEHFDVSVDSVKRAVSPMFNETEKARKRELARVQKYIYEYDPEAVSERAQYKRRLLSEKKKSLIVSY